MSNLAGITDALRRKPVTSAAAESSSEPSTLPPAKPAKPAKPEKGRGGKSSDPRYQKIGIFVRKDLHNRISKHLIDTGEDMSDFFETLLIRESKRLGE